MAIRSASTLRALQNAECAYVLFIDGVQYAFATEHDGDGLLGTGANSWIGKSQTAIGTTVESAEDREVKPGLKMTNLQIANINFESGQLNRTTVNFTVSDWDGTVFNLFAAEGKDRDFGGEEIPAGNAALSASIARAQGGGSVTIRDRHINIEKIGPSGERRVFPALPKTLIGFEHPYVRNSTSPVEQWVSEEPILWEGRLCCLYRIYKDPLDEESSESDKWVLWEDAYDAGDLVWWGTVRGIQNATPWSDAKISCFGPDGMLSRKLGVDTDTDEYPIEASTLKLAAEQRTFAVSWRVYANAGQGYFMRFNGSIGNNDFAASYSSQEELVARINNVIEDSYNNDTALGTNGNNSSSVLDSNGDSTFNGGATSPALSGYHGAPSQGGVSYDSIGVNELVYKTYNPGNRTYLATYLNCQGGFGALSADQDLGQSNSSGIKAVEGGFWVRMGDGSTGILEMSIVMHERVWRFLGYDPLAQMKWPPEEPVDINFERVDSGEDIPTTGVNLGPLADGYWRANFTTEGLEVSDPDSEESQGPEPDNGGQSRFYPPIYGNDLGVLYATPTGDSDPEGQIIEMPRHDFSMKGQNTLTLSDKAVEVLEAETSPVTPTDVRIVVFKGKMQLDPYNEPETIYQVAKVAYRRWQDGEGFETRAYLDKWDDPRLYGFENGPLDRDWLFSRSNSPITARFLNAYPYNDTLTLESCAAVTMQMLLSTGTANGYLGTGSNSLFSTGNNAPTDYNGTSWEFGDNEIGDLGLGIPSELVDTIDGFIRAFSSIPGGGAEGPLCAGRVFFNGPFDSDQFFRQMMMPRRLMWRLHGKKYGMQPLEEFALDDADITITNNDIYGAVGDPTSTYPKQNFIATAPVDQVIFQYGKNAWTNEYSGKMEIIARDRGSRFRSGVRKIEMNDPVLNNPDLINTTSEYMRTGQSKWTGAIGDKTFRDLWTYDAPGFMSKTHYEVNIRVNRIKGQDCMPGTIVNLSNQWTRGRDGALGVTAQSGVVTGVTLNGEDHTYNLSIILYGEQQDYNKYFMPIAKVNGVSGSTIYLENDYFGNGRASDAAMFAEPSFSSAGIEGSVYIFDKMGHATSAYQVASVDTSAHTITVTGGPITGVYRDAQKWVAFAPYDSQPAGAWVLTYGLVVMDDDLTFGSGNTDGSSTQALR